MHKIVVIGGAGDMVTVTIKAIVEQDEDVHLTIVDYNAENLERRKQEHRHPHRAEFIRGDLFDQNLMNDLVSGADLVLNAAGPYYKTALPVLKICMANRVNYCDLNDEPDTSLEAIKMHEEVKKAGIGAYIGLGASPGLTNIFAKELIEKLDEPVGVDTVWVTGDEGDVPYGRAVIAHAILIFGGHKEALTYRDGKMTTISSFVYGEKFFFSPPLGELIVFELSHPEPITIPHYYPQLKQVRNFGGLHPQAQNGLFRGLGRAVADNRLRLEEAIDFVQAIAAGKSGSLKCWKHAWSGMREQVKTGENSSRDFWDFLWKSLQGKHYDFRGAVLVKVWGLKDGHTTKLVRRTASSGPGTFFCNMAQATGTPFAAVSRMVLDGQMAPEFRKGLYCPEVWVEVPVFYRYMKRYGVDKSDLVEPIFQE